MYSRLDPHDANYPPLLRVAGSPPALWVRGTVSADDALAIAIVGSRRSSAYGIDIAGQLAADLASRGVTVVSGLARGIDSAAHRGALAAGGRTLAVLGSGVDRVYPPENRALAEEVVARGAIVSQFVPGAAPLPHHFPARNRTIAGLALGVVVVEAAERSGALITAGLAGEIGREVFAVPGRVTSETSRGCHGLLRDGATLVRDWADVVAELPEEWRRLVRPLTDGPRHSSESEARGDGSQVLQLLTFDEPQHIEQLIERSGLAPALISRSLLQLELDGWARQLPGQRWLGVTRRT